MSHKLYESHFKNQKMSEMANLSTKITGLSHGTVFISNKDSSHNARIKYYRGRPDSTIKNSIISISKNPEIIHDPLNLTVKEKEEIFKFIKINYTKLISFWVRGEKYFIDEFLAKIKKISE